MLMEEAPNLSVSLVPELHVSDLDSSLAFYVGLIGFEVVFQRLHERFAYLALGQAELMLQDAAGPGRRFRTAALARPFGRGINLQIAVPDVDHVHQAVVAAGLIPVIDVEERWYDVNVVTRAGKWRRVGPRQTGHRQLVVEDPDGYLLRLFTGLGTHSSDREC